MKQSTIVVLVALIVFAGLLFFADARYGMHHYMGSSWGPGHMMWYGDSYGPGHMWDDFNDHDPGTRFDRDEYGPGRMWHEYAEVYVDEFRSRAEAKVIREQGQPIEGVVPFMLMRAYPGLEEEDFDGVDAAIGRYIYVNGELQHDLEGARSVHSAAEMITAEGYEQLLENVAARLGVMMHNDIDDVLDALAEGEGSEPISREPQPEPAPQPPPTDTAEGSVVCTSKMKQAEVCTMEYAPVCGTTDDGTMATYSNGCVACSQGNIVSYTSGACAAE